MLSAGETPSVCATSVNSGRVDDSKLKEDFLAFDHSGSGDHDGKVEYNDLNPYSLVQKFRTFSQYWAKKEASGKIIYSFDPSKKERLRQNLWPVAEETAALWNTFASIQEKLQGNSGDPERIVPEDIIETLSVLYGEKPYGSSVFREDFSGEIGGVIGDSLTASMQFATQSVPQNPETPAYLLPKLVLQGILGKEVRLSVLTLDRNFPFSGHALLEPEGNFAQESLGQLGTMLFRKWINSKDCLLADQSYSTDSPVLECLPFEGAQVHMAAIPGATLQDALVDLRDSGDWHSSAMVFLNRHRYRFEDEIPEEKKASLLQHTLGKMRDLHAPSGKEKGGFFAVALGSNDLLSYRNIIVSTPTQNAGEYEKHLEELDIETRHLTTDRGIRRIFFIPPNVAEAFHALPKGAEFSDGSSAEGYFSLFHWLVEAQKGRQIPQQYALSEAQRQHLENEYYNYREAIERVLVQRSNWLVLDNQWDLPAAFKRIAGEIEGSSDGEGKPFVVREVPGYGRIRSFGRESLFSPDNEHPSNLGYLLWSELISQAAFNRNIAIQNSIEPLQFHDVESKAREVDASVADLMERMRKRIRENPSVYRPRRLPEKEILRIKEGSSEDTPMGSLSHFREEYLDDLWPYLSHTALNELLKRVQGTAESLTLYRATLGAGGAELIGEDYHDLVPHHVKAGFIREYLLKIESQNNGEEEAELLKELKSTILDWAEDYETTFQTQVRFAAGAFSAIGARENSTRADYHNGETPGIVDTRRLYKTVRGSYVSDIGSGDSRLHLQGEVGWNTNLATTANTFSGLPDLATYLSLTAGIEARAPLSSPTHSEWDIPVSASMHLYSMRFPKMGIAFRADYNIPSSKSELSNISDNGSRFDRWVKAMEPSSHAADFKFWPSNQPAFEKEGWALTLGAENYFGPQRSVLAGVEYSF